MVRNLEDRLAHVEQWKKSGLTQKAYCAQDLQANDRIFLYRSSVDMRKGFHGLSGLVANELKMDVLNGDIFVFINRGKDRIKLLRFEKGGLALYYKRLEKGRLELPTITPEKAHLQIDWATLAMMIEGISLHQISRKKRYEKL